MDIAEILDEQMQTGAQWHRELLNQMAAPVMDARPAVISAATKASLDEFRKFRHLVRNVYALNLRPSVAGLNSCLSDVSADFNQFANFLDQLAQA
ncbi:MAG: hypothetical protein LC737_02495, partial [Chloroflexi bacterium]|nr:hypothetical protein [Chloroflexota bacterium]